jgi:hypothetical protein
MIFLQLGDKLPPVAVVQALLNARIGDRLRIDGFLGPLTQHAIKDFQQATKCAGPSGKIDNATWRRLNRGVDLTVEETVDVCDPQLMKSLEEARAYNPNAMAVGCMSNATDSVINEIVARNKMKSVVLLRFIGHGASGLQAVGMGRGDEDIFGEEFVKDNKRVKPLGKAEIEISKNVHFYSSITTGRWKLDYIKSYLARLRPVFSPFGSLEFHGCNVAKEKVGFEFIQDVSNIVQVPVSASQDNEHIGRNKRFVGPVRTAFPAGSNLHRWAAALPKFNMSLP